MSESEPQPETQPETQRAPSAAVAEDPETDDDLKHADTPMIAKLAASVSAASGLFFALCGLQLVGARFHPEWLELVPYAQLSLGIAQIFVAAMIFRARPWAVYVGTGGGALIALASIGWFFFFLLGVGISCMVWVTPPLSVLAAVLSGASIRGVLATGAARRRLAQRGFGLGL